MNVVLETAPYTTECITCRSLIEVTVTEVLTAGTHEWDIAGDCPECGACWHECSYPTPLPGMRAAILAANGPTDLHLAAGSATPATEMRALRKVKALSLTEARAMAEELRSRGLSGTRVEMEVLAIALRAAGVLVTTQSSGAV
ncbi:hypothetical protein [Nocardia sp. XZ_19_385]|uniref:hypothetical protein n=1 Tax=Nocardia sp. XZ_19_385 TaxID=2769488 RepID=UPI00188EF24D|nr:hypothetical protein [Nocardia sp. XZ_19_385]